MAVTLKDIAARTGFSVTTVSRALGGFDDVNAETRQHIIEMALEMGYQPNLVARQLRSQRTQTIGMIIPADNLGFTDDFFSELMMGVGRAASNRHYDLLVSAQGSQEDEMDAYNRIVGGKRVDGMLLARTRRNDPRIEYLKKSNFPFVVFGRSIEQSDYPFMDVDGEKAQYVLTRHFIDLGYRDIAYIPPHESLNFASHRMRGFQAAMRDHQLTINEDYVLSGYPLTQDGGREAAQVLLSLPSPPNAIMTGNDLSAIGAMKAIQERGLKVGRDIVIGGFDDIPLAAHFEPGLTTMRQSIGSIAARLTTMLLDIIAEGSSDPSAVIVDAELVVRGSSSPSDGR